MAPFTLRDNRAFNDDTESRTSSASTAVNTTSSGRDSEFTLVSNIIIMSYPELPPAEPDLNRDRLPTFKEVLQRKTLSPVDLFSFYIYMRDQMFLVDYLDFWLDVTQHLALCRHYVRELRRSVLIETPEQETPSKRSSAFLDQYGDANDTAGPSTYEDEKDGDHHLSAFLRRETSDGNFSNGNTNHSPHSSLGSQQSDVRNSGERAGNSATRPPRASFMSSNFERHFSDDSPAHTIGRPDIRASAEKILYTYLLPGSEREIILPQNIVHNIIQAIEEQMRDDPEVFDIAKDYVFQAMERDAFPGFLRWKALGNLIPASIMWRVALGLLGMFAGFWAGFVLIFLDQPKHIRCWVILPFTIGVYCLATQQYFMDPILALCGLSEHTFMHFSRIQEPFVRRLLYKRAITALVVTVLVGVAVNVLFIFVPGHRL